MVGRLSPQNYGLGGRLLWCMLLVVVLMLTAYIYGLVVEAKTVLWKPDNLSSVTSGDYHTCALAAGAVYCWGRNDDGRIGDGTITDALTPTPVDTSGVLSGKTVTAVSAGDTHTCAVASGAVYCWGDNSQGQLGNNSVTQSHIPVAVDTSGVLSGKTVTAVSAGDTHTCAIASGAVYCWGDNSEGELGNNSTQQSLTPVAVVTSGVLSGKMITALATGNEHSCVVASGAVYCWGVNVFGQLGNNTTSNSSVPIAVQTSGALSGKTVTALSVSSVTSCAVASGAVYCWGYNTQGQLGNNSTQQSLVPTPVDSSGVLAGKTVTSVYQSFGHTCAIASGAAYCWGANYAYQLGTNSYSQESLVPVAVYTGGDMAGMTVSMIAPGALHTCAIASGTIFCWGSNDRGTLGDTSAGFSSHAPRSINSISIMQQATHRFYENSNSSEPGLPLANTGQAAALSSKGGQFRLRMAVKNERTYAESTYTDLTTNTKHTCGVSGGAIYCWGNNSYGQLGDGTTSESLVPTAVNMTGVLSGKTVTKVVTGYNRTCALASGAIYCWGSNAGGALGNGSTDDSPVPVAVEMSGALAGKTITSISAGSDHTCVLASGAVYCWGKNEEGELGNGTTTNSSVPVAVDMTGVLSGKTVTQLTGGDYSSCLVAAGAAYCWGANWDGELGNGDTTHSSVPVAVDMTGVLAGKTITSISSSFYHTCVLAGDAPYCWGANWDGGLGDGTTTDSLVPVAVDVSGILSGKVLTNIAAGGYHTCLLADNTPYCWGQGVYGQLGNNSTTSSPAAVSVDLSGALAGKTVTKLIAGYLHSCVIADGAAYCWGDNDYYGQLGNNSKNESHIPVAVASRDALALQKGVMFQMRFAKKTASTCSAQSTGYAAVSSTSAIAWDGNGNTPSGGLISSSTNDPTGVSETIYQSSVSSGAVFTTLNSAPAGKFNLWDFSLRDNSSLTDTTYCFKIFYADGQTLDQYTNYPQITTAPASIAIGFVNATGQAVGAPAFAMQQMVQLASCQTSTGVFGSSTGNRLRIAQGSGAIDGWSVSIAPDNGSLSLWQRSDRNASYDFNDPSGSPAGCNSGADGDGVAGQLKLGLGSMTVTPQTGCTTNGLSTNNATIAFSDATINAVTLTTASGTTQSNCYWDLFGMSMSQTIPADQAPGSYELNLTATVVAQ